MLASLNHHAYALVGSQEGTLVTLIRSLERCGIKTRGNPDFRSEVYDVFGIDEARELKDATYRKAVSGNKKVFVISARGITAEAQNALLKVLEEPPEGTQIFLILPSLEILLPTLRSRLHILSDVSVRETAITSDAADFLASPVPKRLKTIQGMLKTAEEEMGKQKLVDFLDALEHTVAEGDRTNNAVALSEILEVKKYSRDRAPSLKLLLEHLALVLPVVK
ncbi:MAG: hypothetical protein UY50_C0008G0022 [Parcubacteria group bacterium GW2011_GWA2_49_9]|nr:MAG: hypothetical protein UY50_C0008G0022 [Parcubacteria group bacterium GW2011_GWA2_49_9]